MRGAMELHLFGAHPTAYFVLFPDRTQWDIW